VVPERNVELTLTGAPMSYRLRWTSALAFLVTFGVRPLAAADHGTPSFARQTGLACSACHTHYPELTATGRAFKLNGYVYRRGSDSLQGRASGGEQNLLLGLVTPLSFMLQTSFTATQKAQPGSSTVVTNQYATSVPLGETFASIAPVPGAGVLIGGLSSIPLWVIR
jgi:hypothetical protein